MTGKFKEKDGNRNIWGKSTEKRSDMFVNHDGDGPKHCHLYNNKETGEHGVVHRGTCAVCHDRDGKPFDNRDKRRK